MAKMNMQQKNYARAKALVDTLKTQEQKIEQEYIQKYKIINPDDSIPEHIWCIEDEVTFNRANEETAAEIDALGIYDAEQVELV